MSWGWWGGGGAARRSSVRRRGGSGWKASGGEEFSCESSKARGVSSSGGAGVVGTRWAVDEGAAAWPFMSGGTTLSLLAPRSSLVRRLFAPAILYWSS